MPKKRKWRVGEADPILHWQFPDEETWLAEQANGFAPPTQLQPQRWRMTEQRVLLLLLILVSVGYWLWSATQHEEEASKTTTLPLLMIQGSANDGVEPNPALTFSSTQQPPQVPSPLKTVGAKNSVSDATPSSQQEPICFWSHIACNRTP